MRLVKSKYNGNSDELRVVPMGDWHIGHINCDYNLIEEYLSSLNNTTRCLLMGDLLECATKTSIGQGMFETNLTPQQQKNKCIEILRPYKDYIDGAIIGNHEERIMQLTSINLIQEICEELNIPCLGYKGIIKYVIKDNCYTVEIWHGSGGGASIQTALKAVEDMSTKTHADVYCMGHTHKIASSNRIFLYPDTRNNKIRKIKQYFVLTGSALKYDEGYGEMKNLQERPNGFPVIILNGNKHTRSIDVIL